MPVRVLLVDAVPEIRRLVRTALRFRGGFEVVAEAADGLTAVEQAIACRPDIVVLDLGLPVLAGQEVIARLRQWVPDVKVVVYTGSDSEDAEAVRERVSGYLVKDADIDYLVDLLENLGRTEQRSARIELGPEPRSAALARRFAETYCTQWRCEAVLDSAALVVSELVTNAVMHAPSSCEVRLSLAPSSLRIEVADEGRGSPNPFAVAEDDEQGRGLLLVTAVATAWGVEARQRGKVVWAELCL